MKLKKDALLLTLGCCVAVPFTGTSAMAATQPVTEPITTPEVAETKPALLAEATTFQSANITIPATESVPAFVSTSVLPATVLPSSDLPASQLQMSLHNPVLAQLAPTGEVTPQAPTQPETLAPFAPPTPSVAPVPVATEPLAQPTAKPSNRASDLMNLTAQAAPAPAAPSTPASDLFMPPQLFNLDTANHLSRGDNTINVGFRWYFPAGALKNLNGRGQQVVFGGFSSGITDRIQLDLGGFYIGDFLTQRVNGFPLPGTGEFPPNSTPFVGFGGGFVQGKYQVIRGDRLRMSVAGSFEMLAVASSFPVFTNDPFQNRRDFKWSPAGAIQLPVTYTITRGLQAHFTPTLAILPENMRGGEFYGTSFIVGGGLSWQPAKLIGFFGDVNYPVGPGGNTVRSSDGDIVRRPVWSGGVRFNFPEFSRINVMLDLYATNAMGTTPATRALSQLPDSNQVSFSSNLTFRF
jgi:hypothetical protein